MKGGVCKLLLWIAAFTHFTAGMINLETTEMEVDEGIGNFNLCLTTDEVLCLSVTSQDEDAEEDKDYRAVSNVSAVSTGSKWCIEIAIINDNRPEPDESFTVKFSKVTDQCGVNGGSGSGGGDDQGMLQPMTNAVALITIKDDDFLVVIVSSVIAGCVVLLLALIAIPLVCCVVVRHGRLRKQHLLISSNRLHTSYIEFNPDIDLQTYHSDAETTRIHEAIADVQPSEFAAYVKELHNDVDKGFSQQYSALQAHSPQPLPCKAAELDINTNKNRYHNILPYDDNRVVLPKTDKNSDYINASWINGYDNEKTYVSCQGPLPETVADFWCMIWELQTPTIVMLTKTVEATKVKCEQYWPHKVKESISLGGELSVLLQEVIPFADYEIRKLLISNNSEQRTVTHYYFQAWPDHGVPRYATALLGFIRHVRKCHPPSNTSPVVVHCSAGVGRTGTFIVLDIMLQALEAKACINVYNCILKLRAQRPFMVQTEAQYIFIHDALEELITCGKTEISAGNLRIATNRLGTTIPDGDITGFEQQFQLLEQVTRQPKKKDLEVSRKIFNTEKNRYSNIVPYDFQRVYLRVTGQPGSDYINASWINGYRESNAFMVTQSPLKNTVNDFWRMVWEQKSRTIIMLCSLKENDEEVCEKYWPDHEKQQSYGNLTVNNKTELILNDDLCSRVLEVNRSGSNVAPIQEMVTVTQFHFHGWPPDGLPSNPGLLLDLMDRVLKNQISTGNKPIVVMCSDGSGRSGAFVVLYSQLERLKTEHVVDVFQGIKAARTQRMRIVHSVECYKMIHDLLIKYLTSFRNYDNFELPKN